MTQAQFNADFKKHHADYVTLSETNRRLLYNDTMQAYYEDGSINAKQLANWGHPKFLVKAKS